MRTLVDLNSSRLRKFASRFSLAFCLLMFCPWIGALLEAKVGEIKLERRLAEQARIQMAFEQREIVCLANIAYNEARGKDEQEVRSLIARTVLATVGDPTYRVKTVCEEAQLPGRYSHIKAPTEAKPDAAWRRIHAEMTNIFYGQRVLPRGWACVRSFRASDDYMEKLSDKAIRQLGITVSAKGMKYFAAANVPIDTRGRVTFYGPRGGCKFPSPTM